MTTTITDTDPRLDCGQCRTPGARCFVHGRRSEAVQRQISALLKARRTAAAAR